MFYSFEVTMSNSPWVHRENIGKVLFPADKMILAFLGAPSPAFVYRFDFCFNRYVMMNPSFVRGHELTQKIF